MRKRLSALPLLLVLAPLVAAAAAADDDKKAKPYDIGSEVDGAIALRDIDGKSHALKDYRGKPVVLNFWSIQCPYSVGYEQRLKALHAKYSERGVAFLMLDANHTEVDRDAKDPYARIRKYVEKAEVPYPILIDENNVVADRFAATSTPHFFVLDAKGVLRYAGNLDDDPRGTRGDDATPNLANALDDLLAGKKVRVERTKEKGCSIKRVPKPEPEDGERKKKQGGRG